MSRTSSRRCTSVAIAAVAHALLAVALLLGLLVGGALPSAAESQYYEGPSHVANSGHAPSVGINDDVRRGSEVSPNLCTYDVTSNLWGHDARRQVRYRPGRGSTGAVAAGGLIYRPGSGS